MTPARVAGVPTINLPLIGKPKAERGPGTVMYEARWEGVKEDRAADHDLALAQRIGAKLTDHYPGHPWFVEVDSNGGMAHISIPVLMENWRYNLKLKLISPGLREVVKAGGEILERWRIPRATYDAAAFNSAMRTKIRGPKKKPPS